MRKLSALLLIVLSVCLVGTASATNGPPKHEKHRSVAVCLKGKTFHVDKYQAYKLVKHYGATYGKCRYVPPVTPPVTPAPAPQVNRVLACADKAVFRSADGSFGLSGDVTVEILASGTFQGAKITVARWYAAIPGIHPGGATCNDYGGAPNGKFADGPYPVWVR